MNIISVFSTKGHTVLREFEPQTADMQEVNAFIDEMEKQYGGRAFDLHSGEPVDVATPENKEIVVLGPFAGG